jgi:hypothetical protein
MNSQWIMAMRILVAKIVRVSVLKLTVVCGGGGSGLNNGHDRLTPTESGAKSFQAGVAPRRVEMRGSKGAAGVGSCERSVQLSDGWPLAGAHFLGRSHHDRCRNRVRVHAARNTFYSLLVIWRRSRPRRLIDAPGTVGPRAPRPGANPANRSRRRSRPSSIRRTVAAESSCSLTLASNTHRTVSLAGTV